MASQENKNTPDFECSAYSSMSAAWVLWGDVLAGQDAIKAKTTTYLPKEPAEMDEDYKTRLARSLFFEDSRDCQINLTGMVFRKSPTLSDDVPTELQNLAENIDNAGTHLDVFLQRVFEDGFYGHSFIVVDMPALDESVKTAADEKATGRRSYWCMRQARDAKNWRTRIVNGETVLQQISFKECTKEADGRFGETEVVRYRVYLLDQAGNAKWELWKETVDASGKKEVILESEGPIKTKKGQPLKRLPVAVHYGEFEGLLESRPPLKGIADINVTYYQKYSDLSNIEHYTCAPTLVITGGDDQKADFVMGGNRAIFLPTGAEAEFLQVDGKSIEHLEKDLQMLEKRLVAKGLDFIKEEHRVPTTATEAVLAYTERTSKLAKMVRSMIDCAEDALAITAEMEGLEQGGSISLGVDENSLTLDTEQLRVFSEMNEKGQLTLPTLWAMMGRADLLPKGFKAETEQTALDEAAAKAAELQQKMFNEGSDPIE